MIPKGKFAPALGLLRRVPANWIAAALTCAAAVLLAAVSSAGTRDWAVGLGMDRERASLIASMLEVAGGAAAVTLVWARPGAARIGAVVAMVFIEVIPFLGRAGTNPTPPGLTVRVDTAGWVLQPLGMLLLGILAACLGAGLGLLLHRDLIRSWRALRTRTRLAVVPVAAVAFAAVASGPALSALQDGPVSALYSYNFQLSSTLTPPLASPSPTGNPSGSSPATAPFTPSPFVAGRRDVLTVGGRRVVVCVPGARATHGSRSFRVIYLLHGYPSNPDAAVSSLQVAGVLDQLVATHQMAPTLIVLPDGNGSVSSDAEWGDTANGNRVETWLTSQVIPAVDAHYPTLGAESRGVAGYSAGGFGAVNVAIRHPDLFRWAASWSGYFEARRDIFAGQTQSNSPGRTAPALSAALRMPIYLGAGRDDTVYLDDTMRFGKQLSSLNWVPVHSDVVPGGHGTEAWRDQMVRSFLWLEAIWHGCDHRASGADRSCAGPQHG